MTQQEYRNIFEKTAVYPHEVEDFDLAYLYLGLMDEITEVMDALLRGRILDVLKECGDCLWYINGLYCVYLKGDIPFSDAYLEPNISNGVIYQLKAQLEDQIILLGRRAGKIKKYYRDNNTEIIQELPSMLTSVVAAIEEVYKRHGFSTEDVLQFNYQKLTKRKEADTLHGSGDDR